MSPNIEQRRRATEMFHYTVKLHVSMLFRICMDFQNMDKGHSLNLQNGGQGSSLHNTDGEKGSNIQHMNGEQGSHLQHMNGVQGLDRLNMNEEQESNLQHINAEQGLDLPKIVVQLFGAGTIILPADRNEYKSIGSTSTFYSPKVMNLTSL